jgi:hypothetical protein
MLSPLLAHRDILQRRAISVAIGSIADIGWQPGWAVSVANDSLRALAVDVRQVIALRAAAPELIRNISGERLKMTRLTQPGHTHEVIE